MSQEIEKATTTDVTINANQQERLGEMVNDFETALNLIRGYQRALNMLQSPDPNTVAARKLLNKYNMESLETSSQFRVYLDGRDITDFPDSLPGSAVDDIPELEAGDE